MAFCRWALWQQLATVWLGVIASSAILLWIDLRRSWEFLWLIPGSVWSAILWSIVALFRERPLLATALIVLPLIGVVSTIGLLVGRSPFTLPNTLHRG